MAAHKRAKDLGFYSWEVTAQRFIGHALSEMGDTERVTTHLELVLAKIKEAETYWTVSMSFCIGAEHLLKAHRLPESRVLWMAVQMRVNMAARNAQVVTDCFYGERLKRCWHGI
jgi:hypothetical protein